MPTVYSIRHVVESVLASYLSADAGLAGVNVYKGDSSDVMVLPKIIVLCDAARGAPGLGDPLGNYSCSVRITVVSNADDTTLTTHRERCAQLVGAMTNTTALGTAFTTDAQAQFYDIGVESEAEGVDERSWVTAFSYDLWACLNPGA
jgi:hypothetical protein